ncbi:MAG: 6-phosphogluconolactonase [Deltaproteobacteria bacterium]|nr:6-phosphogluconolactonase [Deltaproteobacteria bacterium]
MTSGAEPPVRQVRRFADADGVCHAAAEAFCAAFEACAAGAAGAAGVAGVTGRTAGRFRVGLSGGSTPRRFHTLLAAAPYRERVDWRAVDFFWGDERALAPEHPDSNYHMARESLLAPLAIAPDQVHRMPADADDLDAAARAYQAEIAAVFGVDPGGPPPPFDLLIQGMGADGHTASLFPGSAALGETERWVVANEVSSADAVGAARRMTFTYPLINAAARVVFLVTGDSKARALAGVLERVLEGVAERVPEGPDPPRPLPAQAVSPAAGSLLWLVDEAAASELRDA